MQIWTLRWYSRKFQYSGEGTYALKKKKKERSEISRISADIAGVNISEIWINIVNLINLHLKKIIWSSNKLKYKIEILKGMLGNLNQYFDTYWLIHWDIFVCDSQYGVGLDRGIVLARIEVFYFIILMIAQYDYTNSYIGLKLS